MGQERLGPSYFFIPLVLGPLNSLLWYVPSLRYTRGLGWRMHCGVEVTESSTNKQHYLSTATPSRCVGCEANTALLPHSPVQQTCEPDPSLHPTYQPSSLVKMPCRMALCVHAHARLLAASNHEIAFPWRCHRWAQAAALRHRYFCVLISTGTPCVVLPVSRLSQRHLPQFFKSPSDYYTKGLYFET